MNKSFSFFFFFLNEVCKTNFPQNRAQFPLKKAALTNLRIPDHPQPIPPLSTGKQFELSHGCKGLLQSHYSTGQLKRKGRWSGWSLRDGAREKVLPWWHFSKINQYFFLIQTRCLAQFAVPINLINNFKDLVPVLWTPETMKITGRRCWWHIWGPGRDRWAPIFSWCDTSQEWCDCSCSSLWAGGVLTLCKRLGPQQTVSSLKHVTVSKPSRRSH